MTIQVNTDKNIEGREQLIAYVESIVKEGLNRYSENITRVEVHLSDENGSKEGTEDKRCLIEVKVEKLNPIVASELALTLHKAVDGATAKIKKSLESKIGKITQY